MRHAVFAAALIPSLVFAVQPTRSASSHTMLATQDSCGAIVDSALYVARERIAGSDSIRAASVRQYFYEHEVTKRAAIARRGAMPARADRSAAVVQFVVGPAGTVDTSTVRIVDPQQSGVRQAEVVAQIGRWRFQPAAVRECPVAQLVQTRAR